MRPIKFRQRIKGAAGSENRNDHWHYWGFIGDSFIGPIRQGNKYPDSFAFTGLLDKNNREVYEGDIADFCSIRYEVTWFGCQFCLIDKWGSLNKVILKGDGNDIEVIGNVHEDPELLKEAK